MDAEVSAVTMTVHDGGRASFKTRRDAAP